jgi:hypothetical protein
MFLPRWGSLERLAFASAVLLAATSCFEDPVSERLQLEFREKDKVAIRLKIDITVPDDTKNRPLQARMRDLRDKLLRGDDEWARRFDLVAPEMETVKLHKSGGLLRTLEREAVIEARDLSRFFSDTSLSFNLVRGPGWTELTLYAGKSKRATWQQQTLLSGRLDDWCSRISAYLSTLADVYGYLDRHPDRAEAVLGAVLRDDLSEEERSRLPELAEDEEKIVVALKDRMGDVWSVLFVDEEQDFSLNEISSLVFDPFPANLSVRVPAKILEHEGFETSADQSIRVPQLTLWGALLAMRDRWMTPDPLMTKVEHARSSGGKPLSLAAFLTQERRVQAVPSSADVKAALTEGLKARVRYRVRWSDPEPAPSR